MRSELFSGEQLKSHAKTLAGWHKVGKTRGPGVLRSRLDENEEELQRAYESVAAAISKGRSISPASEWLIDNYYLIQEQIRTARLHFPKSYSRTLPQLVAGPGQGLPRVYHIAHELIAHLDGRLDPESLTNFIAAYQQASMLKIGELWAVPIMLRLALIENIRRVAGRITRGREEFDLADGWADRLIDAAENRPAQLVLVLADMARSEPPLTHGFVAEMSRRLQGKNPGLAVPLSWIEQRLAEQSQTIEECIQLETQAQAANQVSIGNSIGSIRVLSAIDWREFVEGLSGMEQVLRRDPARVYTAMTFATRDNYRHAVEELAKFSRKNEEDVARQAIELAAGNSAQNGGRRKQHVGYYLIDRGVRELEQRIGVRKPVSRKMIDGIGRMPLPLYLGLILLIAAAMTAGILWLTWTGTAPTWKIVLFGIVAALCGTHLGVGVTNWLTTRIMPPRVMPRMDFSKGIPASARTMVVVPTMLGSDHAVNNLLEDLEVRFLANHDRHLHFALLTDFPDAASEVMPPDERRLKLLQEGIASLAEKYHGERDDIFFLFHRPRRWNERERKWMGYERKRGKLAEFNALLRGGPADRFSVIAGQKAILPSLRYVITLDTDTELPRESARLLVGTIAHPLVRPEIDSRSGRVCEGYGILQPRVAVSLPSANRSWFVKLFAGEPGLDPYTRAVSDVYQDLFQEGSFIGKGIYEVDTFQKALEGRFPENRILSHDLIEGCHLRAGVVSDIQLYEDHPSHYSADTRRRHRWIRGDWQIAAWLLPRVPS
ncbi:MAG TPA: cyclic beta 1-2 glucan synthetase, partial [Phycisphaerae bacterium]|nr:cyclic beta 1-2 glucan synthetase [Phycisphaerae bacterium]